MSLIGMKINGKNVLGDIKIDGKRYYVDEEKTIYKKVDNEYIIVNDKKIIEKIYAYLFPQSIDCIM